MNYTRPEHNAEKKSKTFTKVCALLQDFDFFISVKAKQKNIQWDDKNYS
jgi:hypothetical protein